ncbi:MAG: LysM peptidoglycan-binding domain-containing protein [Novosphingobium sp.]|nr:MAG: LysM peptidoglycan-binding domain-containing protein [Novosphingobium sp.]
MKTKLLAVLSASLLSLSGPALAQSAPRALGQSEVQQAAQQHPQLVEQFGGAVEGPLADYVAGVGRRVAAQTNLVNASGAYRVTLLNSPVRNAFAVPGGYVYVTRELLALMNSEDELAFVLGHEMGHVTARHGQKRQTRSTITGIGAAIAQVLTGSDVVGQVAGQVGQGLLLGYSRSQENESDSLGVRYISAAGFDPYAAPRMLSAMGAAESLDAQLAGRQQSQTPSWSRTHPLSTDRVQRTRALAGQQRPPGIAAPQSRDRFLAAIDGMTYGDDPRQGIVDGRQFRHPGLRFKFTAPQGYTIENGAAAVTIAGSGGQAQFGTGRLSGGLDAYVGQVFRSLSSNGGQLTLPATQTTTINGMPVAYATTRASANRSQVDVTVTAYRWDADSAYHFVTIVPAGAGVSPFRETINSLAPMSASEAAAVRRRVIDVVTVQRGDTARSLAARMAFSDNQLDRFLVLNGLDANATLQPGSKVKLIVYGS